ncbi:MAG: terminase small subunit [Spirochaetaceae bacterium]|jgi:hypothetical protein|nr:terminase small subunit [Spirochaetaceae bacterium]
MRTTDIQQDLFVDAPIWDEGLTGRQRRFVEYYCGDRDCFLNAVKAFEKAYRRPGREPAETSIQSNAARLMRNPRIQDAITRLLRSMQNGEDRLSEYRVLRLLGTLAFYNPADIVDRHGNLNVKADLHELGDLAYCIAGIKKNKDGGKEIKLFDRTRALDMLSRYLDIIRPAESNIIINPNMYLTPKNVEEIREEEAACAPREAEDAEYEVLRAGTPGPENDRI